MGQSKYIALGPVCSRCIPVLPSMTHTPAVLSVLHGLTAANPCNSSAPIGCRLNVSVDLLLSTLLKITPQDLPAASPTLV